MGACEFLALGSSLLCGPMDPTAEHLLDNLVQLQVRRSPEGLALLQGSAPEPSVTVNSSLPPQLRGQRDSRRLCVPTCACHSSTTLAKAGTLSRALTKLEIYTGATQEPRWKQQPNTSNNV